ncbi:hypothetical protein [Clostridium butyricum]|uniref:hypothetical protein n=1 Tax=Clostridium butyricum TaxID=1492 RepID=UPI002AB2DF19|nr:hypothetical protein [Clostridium butyricum]
MVKKYMLINPVFVDAPIEITNKEAIRDIDKEIRESLNTNIGAKFFIRVDKMIYKLVLEEKNEECFKFRLISNIYI